MACIDTKNVSLPSRMTITRLFFYATFATCLVWTGVADARVATDLPAAAGTVGAPAAASVPAFKAPVAHTPASHARATSAAPVKKKARGAAAAEASAAGTYHVSHPSHPLESYQNAVTPRPATDPATER